MQIFGYVNITLVDVMGIGGRQSRTEIWRPVVIQIRDNGTQTRVIRLG